MDLSCYAEEREERKGPVCTETVYRGDLSMTAFLLSLQKPTHWEDLTGSLDPAWSGEEGRFTVDCFCVASLSLIQAWQGLLAGRGTSYPEGEGIVQMGI